MCFHVFAKDSEQLVFFALFSFLVKEQFEFFNLAPITSKFKPYFDAVYNHYVSQKPLIPTYEVDIAIFAIEGLGSLVECSLTQDQYGVVQKNLSSFCNSRSYAWGSFPL